MSKYAVIYEAPSQEGSTWTAHVPDLPGCVAIGETKEECEQLMAEALPAHVRFMAERGIEIPAPSTFVTMAEAA